MLCQRDSYFSWCGAATVLVLLSAGPSLLQGCSPDHRFCTEKSGGKDSTHPSKTLAITLGDRAPWPPPILKKTDIPIFTGNWGARVKACLASICRNSSQIPNWIHLPRLAGRVSFFHADFIKLKTILEVAAAWSLYTDMGAALILQMKYLQCRQGWPGVSSNCVNHCSPCSCLNFHPSCYTSSCLQSLSSPRGNFQSDACRNTQINLIFEGIQGNLSEVLGIFLFVFISPLQAAFHCTFTSSGRQHPADT